ncbi:MAG: NAD(P)-binding domain-containing protein, partial [Streptosporangiaceae bacterium]
MTPDSTPGEAAPPDAGHVHPARLNVGVVGAGRAGTALAVALSRAGHRITAASAVSDASRRRVDRFLPGTPVRLPEEVVGGADLVLLTVPDDALPGLV